MTTDATLKPTTNALADKLERLADGPGFNGYASSSQGDLLRDAAAALRVNAPARIHISEIDPDFRRHDTRARLFCYRCGKDLKPESVGCSIRIVDDEPSGSWIVNAFWPMGGDYYAIGKECARKVPAEFRMEAAAALRMPTIPADDACYACGIKHGSLSHKAGCRAWDESGSVTPIIVELSKSHTRHERLHRHAAFALEQLSRRIEALAAEKHRDEQRIARWRADEHELSAAYVRLRAMIPGAFDTDKAPTAQDVWAHTERCLRAALTKRGASE